MGQSEVLLGICGGTHWELDGNVMKTWWEYIGNNPKKIQPPPPPPKYIVLHCLVVFQTPIRVDH
jgi:hypothetical protein